MVRLLEVTLVRVGNGEYARANDSYGLTTLRTRRVKVTGDRLRFGFRGKSGVRHAIDVRDAGLARAVKRCRELPGHELFTCLDEAGETRTVDSADVNAWLREVAGEAFTAKDFRTRAGTVLAAQRQVHEARDDALQVKSPPSAPPTVSPSRMVMPPRAEVPMLRLGYGGQCAAAVRPVRCTSTWRC